MYIAVTRFSVFKPNSSAWSSTRSINDIESIQNYKNELFNEERLNFRIGFLSKVTIPLLKKASQGFKLVQVIEYSNILPQKFKNILFKLELQYDFIKLNEYDEMGNSKLTFQEIAIEHFQLKEEKSNIILGQFTLDDDDCLTLDYFKKSIKYLNKAFYGHILSYGSGVYGIFDENNKLINITETYHPKVNIGLMRIGIYKHETKTIALPRLGRHTRSDTYSPTILDSRDISFWWSKHKSQDTAGSDIYNNNYNRLKSSEHIENQIINEKFGIDFIENINSIT